MSSRIIGPNQTLIEVDYEEVQDIYLGLLEFLEGEQITVETGVIALAFTLGKMLNPKNGPLSPEDTAEFVRNLLNWSGMYFVEGSVN